MQNGEGTGVDEGTWPGRAPYAVCLTHDVDRIEKKVYHYLFYGLAGGLRGILTQIDSLRLRLQGREPYWNFEHIMELEDRLGARSTFLFLNESARGFRPKYWGRYEIGSRKVRDVIKTLDRGGWEVGLHGSYRSYDDIDLLRLEKETLEDILGKRVRSTRQHYLNLRNPETLRFQRAVGLEVDSTIGYTDQVWDASRGTLPYYPDDCGILELPITVMDTIGLHSPDVRKKTEAAVERIAAAGGLIVLDWHQRTFSPSEYSEAVDLYVSIVERARSARAWIATMGEVSEHWQARRPPPSGRAG